MLCCMEDSLLLKYSNYKEIFFNDCNQNILVECLLINSAVFNVKKIFFIKIELISLPLENSCLLNLPIKYKYSLGK